MKEDSLLFIDIDLHHLVQEQKHKLQVAQTIANLYVLDKPNSIGCNLQLNTKSSLLARYKNKVLS